MKNLIPFYPIIKIIERYRKYQNLSKIMILDYSFIFLISSFILIIIPILFNISNFIFYLFYEYLISILLSIIFDTYYKTHYEKITYNKEYLIEPKNFQQNDFINSLKFKYKNELIKIELKDLYNFKTKETEYFAIDEYYEKRKNIKIVIIKDYFKNKNTKYYKNNIIKVYYPENYNELKKDLIN